ncbi:MAG TPA: hypothetical protein PLF89_16335 [bacterium]|nr:hypothetical protein [bacterium]
MAEPTPEEYRRFISGIDLRQIQLAEMNCKMDEKLFNERLTVNITSESRFAPDEGGFSIIHEYKLTGKNAERKTALKISAVYLLHFSSHRDMKPEYFEIYKQVSLPINIWPFFRELVHATTSRMNIPPLTLPLIKR